MKRVLCKIAAAALALALALLAAGCGKESAPVEGLHTATYMNYATGIAENGEYDNRFFAKNGINDLEFKDYGVIWVSEEEDPEYGGWFYLYWGPGVGSPQDAYAKEHKIRQYQHTVFRSKNLSDWEQCGVLPGGYCAYVLEDDWSEGSYWAPQAIRDPQSGKYYIYCNANIYQNYGVEGFSTSSNLYDRFYICIFESDTPVGPFHELYDIDPKTGKKIPTINFQKGCGFQYPCSVIDICPYFDDDGQFYLYFNKHTDDHYTRFNGAWGGRMYNMTDIDYQSVTPLTLGSYYDLTYERGENGCVDIESIKGGENYWKAEGINESPYMFKHNGKYYVSWASEGFSSPSYSVHQAVGDSPLGPFRKLGIEEGNPILDGTVLGLRSGTACHSFVWAGNELYITYHRHNNGEEGMGNDNNKAACFDRVNWVKNADGLEVMTANGPSITAMWLPESASDYRDLSRTADIEVNGGVGVKYLNDRVLPYYEVSRDMAYTVEPGEVDGNVEVTLRWDKPVSVSALMVYNARDLDYAFTQVSQIRLKLAEKPSWAGRNYEYAVIDKLKYPADFWDEATMEYVPLGPAIATFDPVKVTEITFIFSPKDRVNVQTELSDEAGLKLSEIVVLGGKENG